MLGGNPTPTNPAATNLLYCGEQFDNNLGQYYLRARYYNPLNGRFNRTDPFDGNFEDPQSLHKYLYAHCVPINNMEIPLSIPSIIHAPVPAKPVLNLIGGRESSHLLLNCEI
jgi:RHS repeat-associated protein